MQSDRPSNADEPQLHSDAPNSRNNVPAAGAAASGGGGAARASSVSAEAESARRRSEAQTRRDDNRSRDIDTSDSDEMLDFFPDDPHRHARRMEAARRSSAAAAAGRESGPGSAAGHGRDASLLFAPYLTMDEFIDASQFSHADAGSSARSSMSANQSQQGALRSAVNSRSASLSSDPMGASSNQRRFAIPSVTLPSNAAETASGATTAASTPRFFDETFQTEEDQRRAVDLAAKGTLQRKESGVAVPAVEPPQKRASIIPSIVVSIFGGGIYGYTTAIIAGLSVPLVDSAFFAHSPASTRATMQGLLTASILIGGLLGTLGSMPLTARFGRKIALITCGAICVAASIGMGVVNNFTALVVLRGVLGLSVGMSATLCPLYNAETAPPEKRGVVGAVYQLSLVSAILLAEIVNYAFNPSNTVAVSTWVWQVQFILGGLFGAGLVVSGLLIPESLVWLHARERKRKARAHKLEMQQRLEARRMSRDEEAQAAEAEMATAAAKGMKGWRGLFHPSNIRWLALAFMLAGGNQLTGINAVIYYAPSIFKAAGFADLALVLTIAVVGVWNLLSVVIAMPLIRRYPRRTLMLVAAVIMTVGMLLMSVTSLWFASSRAVPSIVAILLVVFGFELGPGPLFFVLAAEAFPANILHAGLSLSNQLAWACNIAITFLFPLMTTQLGTGGTFGVFLLINIATLIAYAAALPHHVEHAVITASPSPVSVVLALAEEPEDEPIMGVTDDGEPIQKDDKRRTNSGWGKSERAGIELAPSPPAAGSTAAVGPAAPQKSASWLPDQRALSSSPPYQAKDQLHSDRDEQLDPHKAPLHSPPYPSSSTPQA